MVARIIKEAVEFVEKVYIPDLMAVSYTHLRAHETVLDIVCRLLLEKKTTPPHQIQDIAEIHYTKYHRTYIHYEYSV